MSIKLERSFFAPKTFIRKIEGEGGLEIFITNETDRPSAIAFAGKKAKPVWNYWFRNVEQMNRRINETVESYKSREESKAQRKAERAAFDARMKYNVGDVVVNSWGYDQTNVDAYIITEVTAKRVKLREIATKTVEGSTYSHGMACEVVPHVTDNGATLTAGVNQWGVNFKHGGSRVWDGKSKFYCSWYA